MNFEYQNQTYEQQQFDQAIVQPEYQLEQLGTDPTRYVADGEPMSSAYNGQLGVEQDLYGVVRAGGSAGDTFGIIKISAPHPESPREVVDAFMLTKFSKTAGARAEIVGPLNTVMSVGKNHDGNVSHAVSNKHFTVTVNRSGEVIIGDEGESTFGTQHLRNLSDSEIQAPVQIDTFAGESVAKRIRVIAQGDAIPENPLGDIKTWSAQSADALKLLQDMYSAR